MLQYTIGNRLVIGIQSKIELGDSENRNGRFTKVVMEWSGSLVIAANLQR
jgi:hypothetical protein